MSKLQKEIEKLEKERIEFAKRRKKQGDIYLDSNEDFFKLRTHDAMIKRKAKIKGLKLGASLKEEEVLKLIDNRIKSIVIDENGWNKKDSKIAKGELGVFKLGLMKQNVE